MPVAGLPVGVFGFQEKGGIDGEVQRGLILKANVDGVGLAGGVELDALHNLAFHLFHVVDRASGITADGGFASADDDWRRQQPLGQALGITLGEPDPLSHGYSEGQKNR